MKRIIGIGLLLIGVLLSFPAESKEPVCSKILEHVNNLPADSFPSPKDILAIIHIESMYKPKAKLGPAIGLMQVNGGSYLPKKNIDQGVALLQYLREKFGSRRKAIIAYNIGEGNFQKRRLLKRGQKYFAKVDKVSKEYSQLMGEGGDIEHLLGYPCGMKLTLR